MEWTWSHIQHEQFRQVMSFGEFGYTILSLAQCRADDGADGVGVGLRFFRAHHDDIFGQAEAITTRRSTPLSDRPVPRAGAGEDDPVAIELLDDAPDHFENGLMHVHRRR
jgi:hypothetical protein